MRIKVHIRQTRNTRYLEVWQWAKIRLNGIWRVSKEYSFTDVTSSPKMPQANGEADWAVQTIKNALKKEKDPAKALMSYRATPQENGYSPAEMLFGRKIRTTVPVFPDQLKPSWPGLKQLHEHEQESKIVQTKRYNVSHWCTKLPALKPGGHVWVVNQKKSAVTERAATPMSYVVVTQDGNPIRRNRRHLVFLPQTVQQARAPSWSQRGDKPIIFTITAVWIPR